MSHFSVDFIEKCFRENTKSCRHGEKEGEIPFINIPVSAIAGLCGVTPYDKTETGYKTKTYIQREELDRIIKHYNISLWFKMKGICNENEMKLYHQVNEFIKKDVDEFIKFLTLEYNENTESTLENKIFCNKASHDMITDFTNKECISLIEKNISQKLVMDRYEKLKKIVIEKFGDYNIVNFVYDSFEKDYFFIPVQIRGNRLEAKVITDNNLIPGNDKTLIGYYQLLGNFYKDLEELKTKGNGMPYLAFKGRYDALTQDGKVVEIKNTWGTGIPKNAIIQLAGYYKLDGNVKGGMVIRKNTEGELFKEEFSTDILELIWRNICSELDVFFIENFKFMTSI